MRSVLAVMLFAATAHAGNGANEVSFGSVNRALRSQSADALTGDSLIGGGLGYAHRLDVELPYRLALWADADLSWSGAKGQMFSTLGTEIFDFAMTAGAHVRYQPFRGVAISAGVGLGAQHESLKLTDTMSHVAKDAGWGALGRASARIEGLFVDLPRFSMGVRFELGYVASSGVELVPKQQMDGDTLHIPVSEATLGHLDLSGPYATIGLVSQF